MSINLIIISRYSNTQFVNHVQSLNLAPVGDTNIIYPTDDTYETSLVIPYLRTDMYNLIIYDWSTTLSTTYNADIATILTSSFDLVYLGKYLDTCNMYNLDKNISNFSLVKGTNPIGFNAVLLSGDFTNRLIPKLQTGDYYSIAYAIAEMNITETVVEFATSPNIFVYNPLYNSIDLSKSYNVKTTECQGITSQVIPPSDNNLLIFWIILIIIGVCLIIWMLLNFTSFGINIEKFKQKNAYPSV